jgi:hypothetical protein
MRYCRRSHREAGAASCAPQADTLALLRTEVDWCLASVDEMRNAHLVPLSHYWDRAALVLKTPGSSPTATNLLHAGVARDIVLVDAV